MQNKSNRNKTIDFDQKEGEKYIQACLLADNHERLKQFKELISENKKSIENTIIVGDSLSIAKTLPKFFIDLVITDPPYNLTKNYHGNIFSKKATAEYEVFTRSWIEAIKPTLKPTASVYVCCDWKSSLIIGNVLSEYFTIQNRITWQREKGRGAKHNWKNSMEDIWFCTNSNNDFYFNLNAVKIRKRVIAPYKQNEKPKDWKVTNNQKYRDTCPSNFWDDITIPFWSMPENTAHPTQKPEKLIAKIIMASSNPNDLILDPFNGSGTTCVTAKKLGRKYIGIEQNKIYCGWTQKRLQMAEYSNRIQGYENGIFTERNWNTTVL